MTVISTIFEKSIRPLTERAGLFIVKSRYKAMNAFGIQYWVSPSCINDSMSLDAKPKGYTM